MNGVYREFQSPLGVTHAVRGRFGLTPSSQGVVFARKSSIDVFIARANAESARLELLCTLPLSATVLSLSAIRRSSSPDLLCVGFDRMRISFLSWNPFSRTWITEQLLDLGKFLGTPSCSPDGIRAGLDSNCKWHSLLRGCSGTDSHPVIRSDYSGRCVAILSKFHSLFYIVSIRSDEDCSSEEERIFSPSSIFAVDLPSEFGASNVKDFAFLHGMFEPSIVVLYENSRTWSGRSAVQRNTCALLAVSLDLRSKRSTKIWSIDQLPYDSYKLEAVPESARGGVLVISTNVIMQIRHGTCVAGLSLNCFGDAYVADPDSKYDTITKSDNVSECDAAHCRFLDLEESSPDPPLSSHQSIALLSLKGGELYFLHVAVDSRNSIIMKRAGSTVIASEIIPVNDRFFILASRLSDSLLVEYKRVRDELFTGTSKSVLASETQSLHIQSSETHDRGTAVLKPKPKKRKRSVEDDAEYEMMYGVKPPDELSGEESDEEETKERTLDLHDNDNEGTRGVYDDDDELGFVFKADSGTDSSQGVGTWALTVKDTLSCFGPGSDVAVGSSPDAPAGTQWDLVVAGGYAKNGCLAVIHQSVRPTFVIEFNVPGCNGIWTLLDPAVIREQCIERHRRNAIVAKQNEAVRLRNIEAREARKLFVQEAVKQAKEQKLEELRRTKSLLSENSQICKDVPPPNSEPSQIQGVYKPTTYNDIENKESGTNLSLETSDFGSLENKNILSAPCEGLPSENSVLDQLKLSKEFKQAEEFFASVNSVQDELLTTQCDPVEKSKSANNEGEALSCKLECHSDDMDSESLVRPEKVEEIQCSREGTATEMVEPAGILNNLDPDAEHMDDPSRLRDDQIEDNSGFKPPDKLNMFNNENLQTDGRQAGTNNTVVVNVETGESTHVLTKRRKSDEDNAGKFSDICFSDVGDIEIGKEMMLQFRLQAEESIPLEAEEALETPIDGEDAFHSYMLLSTNDSSTVLTTHGDLEEVAPGELDFVFSEKTIAAGNVLRKCAIVQVVPSTVLVIMNGKKQCAYNVPESELQIKKAQISDPLVMIQTVDNAVTVLRVDAEQIETSTNLKDNSDFLGEGEFDEYGMFAGTKAKKEPFSESTLNPSPNKGEKNTIQSYRGFSLNLVFQSKERLEGLAISCAYLYAGPLAKEIAAEGVIETDTPCVRKDADPEAFIGASKSARTNQEVDFDVKNAKDASNAKKSENSIHEDDEDRMLYGDEEEDVMLYGTEGVGDSNSHTPEELRNNANTVVGEDMTARLDGRIRNVNTGSHQTEKGVAPLEASSSLEVCGHLLILVTKDGGLRVLSADLSYETVFHCPFFYTAPNTVTDYITESGDKHAPAFPPAPDEYQIDDVAMAEVAASYHLQGFSTPLLVVMTRMGLPLIYRAFMSLKPPAFTPFRSRLTFKRVEYRDSTARWCARLMKKASTVDMQKCHPLEIHPIPFQNICGRSGMFIGGPCPAFIFAERGYPHVHEHCFINRTGERVSKEDYDNGQGIQAFAEFNILNCSYGFAYVGDDEVVRIGVLPEAGEVNFDTPNPFRKVALRCTPHKVAYHRGSSTYGVLASMPTLTTREERLARILQSLEKHDKRHYQHTAAQAEAETGDEMGDRVPPLFEELHELRIYRPDNWNLIKSHKLRKGEVGLTITNMKIDMYKQRTAGEGVEIASSNKGDDGNESLFAASLKLKPKDVLVVGTGYLNGEDSSSRGRLLVFEVSKQEVYTEAGGVYTAFQLQLIAEKELVSPVTAVAAMEGYVIAGVGPLVSVYKLVGDEIVHLSFTFGQLYCTSIASLKQYVVAADMSKSVSFMYFRERNKSVNFLARDYEQVQSYATEFLIEGGNVSIILTDGDGHIRLLNYVHASVRKSRGGKRLLLNGGIQIGSRINRLVRVREPDPKDMVTSGNAREEAGRHGLIFATLDGSIGAIAPVTPDEFESVKLLRKAVIEQLHNGNSNVNFGGVSVLEVSEFEPYYGGTEILDQRLLDGRVLNDALTATIVELRSIIRSSSLRVGAVSQTLLGLDHMLCQF